MGPAADGRLRGPATAALELVTTAASCTRSGVLRARPRASRNTGAGPYLVGPAGGQPAAAGAGRRAARPHRALVPRAQPAAAPLDARHLVAESRRGRTGHDATAGAGRRHARLRLPHRRGLGRCTSPGAATTVTLAERIPDGARACSAAASCCARRDRASRRARRYTTPWLLRRLQRPRPGRAARPLPRYLRARPQHPRTPAAGRAQHLGGRLLRPRPRPAPRARRRRRRGRRRAVRARRRLVPRPPRRHAPASATGTSTPTSGPTACTR